MATKKRVVRKKITKSAAKAKVNVVVNVNSGNRKKVVGRSAPLVMPAVAPPPMISAGPAVAPHPSINVSSNVPHNALTDGHHEFIKHLTSSMANLFVRPEEPIPPNESFKSPEGIQGNLNKPTDDLPSPLSSLAPSEMGGDDETKHGTRGHGLLNFAARSPSPPSSKTPMPETRDMFLRYFDESFGIRGLQRFNLAQLRRVFQSSDMAAEASAIKRERRR